MKPNRDVDFLFEIGAFRFIERSWRQFYNKDLSNDAEHSYRVGWLALLIATHEGVKDTGKVMKMALLHDLPESRTGDAHHLSKKYVEHNEDLAVTDIFKNTILENEMNELWKEYVERRTLESKIVKDADRLDVDFELAEQEVNGKMMRKRFTPYRKTEGYAKLYTKTAKQIWKDIQSADPNNWYLNILSPKSKK